MELTLLCTRCGSRFESGALFCPHDGVKLVSVKDSPDPLIGTVLLDQFRIEEPIGSGGMGTVYRAHQSSVGRDVAIKVLRPEYLENPDVLRRFEREATIAIRLDHPNLVRVFLTGQLPDGRLYIVMEYLEGRSLAELLDAEGLLSIDRSLGIILKLCAGIHAVHEEGIVHRDIKPENVFLVRRGDDNDFVKVVDFGIARMLEGGSTVTTQPGRVFGTANYISPEAAVGEPIDRRSDVYSVGVLSYQLLCGELPYQDLSPSAMLMKHVREPAPDLRTKGEGARVPDAVAEVVMQAISKDRRSRPSGVTEYVEALAEASIDEGFLEHGHQLLLGTMWSGGRSLASVLGKKSTPAPPMPPRKSQIPPEDEALLSIAPDPFGAAAELTVPRRGMRLVVWSAAAAVLLVVTAAVSFGLRLQDTVPDPSPRSATETLQDAQYERLARQARAALDAGNFMGPPGANVLELTARMLTLRPEADEPNLIREQAVGVLASRAKNAEARNDAAQARELYGAIQVLDPGNSGAARYLNGTPKPAQRPPGPAPKPEATATPKTTPKPKTTPAPPSPTAPVPPPTRTSPAPPVEQPAVVDVPSTAPVAKEDEGIDWTPPADFVEDSP